MTHGQRNQGTPAETRHESHGPLWFGRTGAAPIAAFVIIAVVIGACVMWLRGHGAPPAQSRPLLVLATIPPFTLTDASGRPVSRDDLSGRPWIVDFFFTSCTGPCPELSLRMKSLYRALQHENNEAILVSISVDPEKDRPAVMERYARRLGADPERWLFLTGTDRPAVYELVQKGFLQSVFAEGDLPPVHTTRFLLIDRMSRIRGVYDGLDPATKGRILQDLRSLRAESTASPAP